MLASFEALAVTPGAYVFAVVLGLLFGSLANVCIYRLPPSDEFPEGRSIVKPGSHCFACKQPIRWYDNVPLLAWLWLRGKCRNCKAAFSSRYLLVEALTGAAFGFAWWIAVVAPILWEPFDHRVIHFAVYAAFVFTLVVITFIDLDTWLILDKITYPAIPIFYGASFLLGHRWFDGLMGAAVGYGLVWLISEFYLRVRKLDALGLGDAKLLAVVGALLGWKGVAFALGGGSMIGLVIMLPNELVQRSRGKQRPGPPTDDEAAPDSDGNPSLLHTALPFGPFLCAAALFYLFAEPWLQLNFHLGV
ncbi:MAG TPA: prepilin peptidase [Kofleriaceae bacterium]|nr:prepilin peptidase [Kofleriaceae bacterium]